MIEVLVFFIGALSGALVVKFVYCDGMRMVIDSLIVAHKLVYRATNELVRYVESKVTDGPDDNIVTQLDRVDVVGIKRRIVLWRNSSFYQRWKAVTELDDDN